MAYTDIDKSDDYFNTLIYTGNGTSGRSVTGVGFKPDWVWIKNRDDGDPHKLFDVVRGASKSIKSNSSDAEVTNEENGYVSAFNTDGFTLTAGSSSQQDVNNNGEKYVAWNWLANNTSGSSNTNGSITSTVSANTTSGFSIVSYTGTGSNATVGHGLGVAPKMILVKNKNTTNSWEVFHASRGATKVILLNRDEAEQTLSSSWNNTAPTSSVFSIGTAVSTNGSGNGLIAYCFAEKKGFSKFGSYDGNAGVGAFVNNFQYLGFKPAFVMIKCYNAVESWNVFDNKRNGYNYQNNYLVPNSANAEVSAPNQGIDLLSNGFNPYYGTGTINRSGKSYIYMAFAESPFTTSTGIPTTAR